MVRKYLVLFSMILLQSINGQHIPSEERGSYDYRTPHGTNIDINQVRATVFNFGLVGRTGDVPGEIPFEWPVNSGHYYVAMAALSAGAEFIAEDGSSAQMITVNGRTDQQGNTKGWEPVPGYLNDSYMKIATSTDETSWPLYWPDKMDDDSDPGWNGVWNGYFGKDQFNAEQELYYKISDDKNFAENKLYVPDSTSTSRQGLGMLAGVRVMEWKQILIEDVVFLLHDIKNDGTKDLDKVAFSLWYADFVGGDGNDDILDFDLSIDVAWNYDQDGAGSWGNSPQPGYIAISYIETPGNAVDRIDNDGDGEEGGPIITDEMIDGEELGDSIDNNNNGLIDENIAHTPFGGNGLTAQKGVTFADRIDNDGDGEQYSPTITQSMINSATGPWNIWPPLLPEDELQDSIIHLIALDINDIDLFYKDGIDNNADPDLPYALEYPNGQGADCCYENCTSCENASCPVITQEMIDIASQDDWLRYRVPDSDIILYDVGEEDFGKPYADGQDNDCDGAIDEGIDENIDEMIDESRDDFIDNDGDWTLDDDKGLYGDSSGGKSAGSDDFKPTSGSGTNFQGEPNIDKTDVSESDQMKLTSVTFASAGSIPLNTDITFWESFMQPGQFNIPPTPGNNDLFVSSGFFPLKAGQTERIAMAIAIGNDKVDALNNRNNAQTAYDFDYRFAKAPDPPNVEAVPGNGKVTLYWDDSAEESHDYFMENIGQEPKDFEGYKIYRSTDWLFSDSYKITDGDGNVTFHRPYVLDGESCQWDLKNGISGWHPVDLNGVQFYLGNDTGLKYSFIDTDVVNGQTYYYAVVSYDFGGVADTLEIIPSDSPMRLRINSLTGVLDMGPNVVEVTPIGPSAGYKSAETDTIIQHISGTSSGSVNYEIIDPMKIRDNHKYQLTFKDTVLEHTTGISGFDTLTTLSYTLVDITTDNSDTLIADYEIISNGVEPVIHGFKLVFNNIEVEDIGIDTTLSYWVSSGTLWNFGLKNTDGSTLGARYPADYRVIFTDNQIYTSNCFCDQTLNENPDLDPCNENFDFETFDPMFFCTSMLYPAAMTSFKVQKQGVNIETDAIEWYDINFAFGDFSPNETGADGTLNADWKETDYIIFLDYISEGAIFPTWFFTLDYPGDSDPLSACCNEPQPGDTAYIIIKKPFLSDDIYEFRTHGSYIDTEIARDQLKKIIVIPNPYIAANAFEADNIYSSGRGPREIQFRNLPAECTIRIYTVSGERVQTIEHYATIDNGLETWNLLTKDNLSVSYGVYIYHVEAPGIGEHIGKFALIK